MNFIILVLVIIAVVFIIKSKNISDKKVQLNKNNVLNSSCIDKSIENEWRSLEKLFDLENSTEPLRSFNAKIVGVTFSNDDGTSRQEIISNCKVNDKLYLIPELYKKPDIYAVKVCNDKFQQLGFLSSELAEEISDIILNKKSRVDARIIELIGDSSTTKGVLIEIQKYVIKNRQIKEKKEKVDDKAYDPSIKMHRFSYQRSIQASELEQNGYVDNAIELYHSIIDNKKLEMSDASMPFDRLTIIYRKRKEYHKEIEVINKWIESLEKSNLIEERKSEEIEKLNQRLEKAKKLYQNKNN